MKKLLFLIIISSTAFSQNSEWEYLFDGKSFNGWHQYNKNVMSDAWYIENGEMVLKSNNDNVSWGNDIVTDRTFTNFELSIEWKVPKGGNSGIFFKVNEIPEVNAPWKTGPEIQVLDNENFVGPNTLYHQAPALYDMKPLGDIKYNPHGEWNHLLLKVDHNNNLGSVIFNGEFVYSFPLYGSEWDDMVSRSKFSDDKYYENLVPDHPYFTYAPFFGKFKTGKIGLQDHGWDVRYRNIKIRQL